MTEPSKLRFIFVGQSHSHAFVDAVHQDDRFVVDISTSLEDALILSPDVLALAGPRFTLSEADVTKLLRNGTVLALFRPENELLEAIHQATHTPIHIPSLELHQEAPLLIYSVNDVVHIAPNNDKNVSEDQIKKVLHRIIESPNGEVRQDRIVKTEVVQRDIIGDSVRSIYRAATASHAIMAFVSNMEPPIGVVGFKRGTIDNSATVSIDTLTWDSDGKHDVKTTDPKLIQRYDFNWYTDFYVYSTGADCRGKTSSNYEGIVYTILIDRGSVARTADSAPRNHGPWEGVCSFYILDDNKIGVQGGSTLSMQSFQPSGIASTTDKQNTYAIDFKQDMQMVKNDANEQFTFSALYSNTFSLDRFQQNASPNSSGVIQSMNYKDYYDNWKDPNFETETWWNPGLFEWSNLLGWEIVRPDLPKDNLTIGGLTIFSSSVGNHTLKFTRKTGYSAFKSRGWHTDTDGKSKHKQYYGYFLPSYEKDCPLDLTWPAPPPA